LTYFNNIEGKSFVDASNEGMTVGQWLETINVGGLDDTNVYGSAMNGADWKATFSAIQANDELMDILSSDKSVVAQVNVMGETFAFSDYNLIAMIKEYIYKNMVGVGDYITGAPKNSPTNLLNELSIEFSNDPGINEAYLYQSAFLGNDKQYHNNMVVVLDMPISYYVHVEELVYLIADSFDLSNQIIVAHAESDYGKMLLNTKINPFYKK